jgi:phosphohistidine swiveling domain-containing protein
MVLGVLDATSRIPDGARVAVDGVAGVVRWIA